MAISTNNIVSVSVSADMKARDFLIVVVDCGNETKMRLCDLLDKQVVLERGDNFARLEDFSNISDIFCAYITYHLRLNETDVKDYDDARASVSKDEYNRIQSVVRAWFMRERRYEALWKQEDDEDNETYLMNSAKQTLVHHLCDLNPNDVMSACAMMASKYIALWKSLGDFSEEALRKYGTI